MLWNALLLALRSIRRNVLRSFLTTLGIVIGVASVIIMVNLGSGATLQVKQQIESLGTNLLFCVPGSGSGMANEPRHSRSNLPMPRLSVAKSVVWPR